jgi:arylesterase/paraoxonase
VLSQDKKTVYLAASLSHSLYILSRNLSTNDLHEEKNIFFDSALDNLSLDDEGNVWIVGHPKPLHFELWLMGFLKHAPAQVFKQTVEVIIFGFIYI